MSSAVTGAPLGYRPVSDHPLRETLPVLTDAAPIENVSAIRSFGPWLQADFLPSGTTSLLIIDDDREFCELTGQYLTNCGYAVCHTHTGPDGLDSALAGSWQAIILNVMLPGIDGIELLRRFRQASDAPVLMISAMPGDTDVVAGLEAGADAYLAKGSSHRQILARLHAITRRATMCVADPEAAGHEEIAVAELRIIPEARRASLAGHDLALTPSEFNILLSLARARGRVKTRDHLSAEIRDREYGAYDRALDMQVSCLRRKLGDDPKRPRFIRTVRASGYMLVNPDAP